MGIYLNSNASSLNAIRHLNITSFNLNKSLERLASGYKVNRAGDGPASLLISENMRSQIRGMDAATSNVQQGLSMVQTADGALQQISDALQRIREIAVSASNSTTATAQYAAYQDQLQAEQAAINQIASSTKYGTTSLLNGSAAAAAFNIQMGANSGETMDIATAFATNTASNLGQSQTTLGSAGEAGTLLTQVDTALANVNNNLAIIGGFENRLTNQMNYLLSIAKENFTAAEAQIRNTDVAAETATLARLQIMQQAGAYALATANASRSIALQLLQ